jgi:hypothetical protein
MRRLFLALVCAAMVFLAPWSAMAAFWDCAATVRAEVVAKPGTYKSWTVTENIKADSHDAALSAARTRFAARAGMLPDGTPSKYRFVELRGLDCQRHIGKPKPPPRPATPLPASVVPPKATARDWRCRVKLTWKLDNRSGTIDESLTIEDVATQSAAKGEALLRIQQRARALFSDPTRRRMTFPSVSVTCS